LTTNNIKTEKKPRPLLMHRATFLKEIIKKKKRELIIPIINSKSQNLFKIVISTFCESLNYIQLFNFELHLVYTHYSGSFYNSKLNAVGMSKLKIEIQF